MLDLKKKLKIISTKAKKYVFYTCNFKINFRSMFFKSSM